MEAKLSHNAEGWCIEVGKKSFTGFQFARPYLGEWSRLEKGTQAICVSTPPKALEVPPSEPLECKILAATPRLFAKLPKRGRRSGIKPQYWQLVRNTFPDAKT
jgi:hypothetical protein